MPVSCPTRSVARRLVIAGAAVLCLLVAGNARASIQGRHVVARIGHATPHAHCLPAPAHADPFSSGPPLVAVLTGGKASSYGSLTLLRAVPGLADGGARPEEYCSSDGDPRGVSTLPSHWGATHLSV